MAGYADADSWATDAHKYLNTPYDSGLAFVRSPDVLHPKPRFALGETRKRLETF